MLFTDLQAADLLRVGVNNAESAVSRNLARALYGDDWKAAPRPKISPLRRLLKAPRLILANLFLRCANALGAYNDYE